MVQCLLCISLCQNTNLAHLQLQNQRPWLNMLRICSSSGRWYVRISARHCVITRDVKNGSYFSCVKWVKFKVWVGVITWPKTGRRWKSLNVTSWKWGIIHLFFRGFLSHSFSPHPSFFLWRQNFLIDFIYYLITWTSLIGQFVHPVEEDGVIIKRDYRCHIIHMTIFKWYSWYKDERPMI